MVTKRHPITLDETITRKLTDAGFVYPSSDGRLIGLSGFVNRAVSAYVDHPDKLFSGGE